MHKTLRKLSACSRLPMNLLASFNQSLTWKDWIDILCTLTHDLNFKNPHFMVHLWFCFYSSCCFRITNFVWSKPFLFLYSLVIFMHQQKFDNEGRVYVEKRSLTQNRRLSPILTLLLLDLTIWHTASLMARMLANWYPKINRILLYPETGYFPTLFSFLLTLWYFRILQNVIKNLTWWSKGIFTTKNKEIKVLTHDTYSYLFITSYSFFHVPRRNGIFFRKSFIMPQWAAHATLKK